MRKWGALSYFHRVFVSWDARSIICFSCLCSYWTCYLPLWHCRLMAWRCCRLKHCFTILITILPTGMNLMRTRADGLELGASYKLAALSFWHFHPNNCEDLYHRKLASSTNSVDCMASIQKSSLELLHTLSQNSRVCMSTLIRLCLSSGCERKLLILYQHLWCQLKQLSLVDRIFLTFWRRSLWMASQVVWRDSRQANRYLCAYPLYCWLNLSTPSGGRRWVSSCNLFHVLITVSLNSCAAGAYIQTSSTDPFQRSSATVHH